MNQRYYKYGLVFVVVVIGALCGHKIYTKVFIDQLTQQARSNYVNFDESMRLAQHRQVLNNNFSSNTYAMFKDLYEKNNLARVVPQETLKIPKIIHQIWLGSPFPDEFKAYQQSWRTHHPDWEYKLWTDESVKELKLQNQDLYDASINYGEKSDILRYELLYRYGGLYVDVDFECLQPLDLLHHCYDFYIGIQSLDTSWSQLGIGLIGSVPGHRLLKYCVDLIRDNDTRQVVMRTGPVHCTRVFYDYAGQGPTKDVALPASYFYPCGYTQKGQPPSVWRRPESFAVHHWAASWTKPAGFVRVAKK